MANEDAAIAQNSEMFGGIRLGQAGGGHQLGHILFATTGGKNQFEPANFPQCAKLRGHQLDGFAGQVLK